MLVIALSAAGVVVIAVFGWWAKRRWERVDSYFGRNYQDPPIFDAGSWLGGDRD
jgi:hypothetical protein